MDGIAEAFGAFIGRYGALFRTGTRDNAAVAKRYLHGLALAEKCKFQAMGEVVEGGCAQQFQHFISNSPWQHAPVVAQIGRDADRLLGGKPTSCLIIDESSFAKQGDRSVGVARQWSGRLGKVDNCQVAVFGVLSDGCRHAPVDMRLYLPKGWIDDPARCDAAGVPPEARTLTSKSAHALDIVRQARQRGMRFAWVGVDGGYGKEPAFLRALDDDKEVFVADVHSNQRVWTEPPGLHVPEAKPGRGRPTTKLQASGTPVTVEDLVKTFGAPGSPNKLSDAAAGRWISGQRGGSRSVRCHETGSFCWSCTLGESGYWAAQPPRVRSLISGQGGAQPPDTVAGGEAQDAA